MKKIAILFLALSAYMAFIRSLFYVIQAALHASRITNTIKLEPQEMYQTRKFIKAEDVKPEDFVNIAGSGMISVDEIKDCACGNHVYFYFYCNNKVYISELEKNSLVCVLEQTDNQKEQINKVMKKLDSIFGGNSEGEKKT